MRPSKGVSAAAEFLGLNLPPEIRGRIGDMVRPGSVGKGRGSMEPDRLAELRPHFDGWLERLGYA